MEEKTMNQDFKNAMEFLLFSYFGDISDPIMAAINRAYVDMASHTLTGFKEDKNKWKCREQASNTIYKKIEELTKLQLKNDFDNWHDKLCEKIIEEYKKICKDQKEEKVELSYGQAQKWVNMTLKYLYIFKSIDKQIGFENLFNDYADYEVEFKKEFFEKFAIENFYVPIDSYILGHIRKANKDKISSDNKLKTETGDVAWSKMEQKDYEVVKDLTKTLDEELNIENENHAWIQYALTKIPDNDKSYARYLYNKNHANEKK